MDDIRQVLHMLTLKTKQHYSAPLGSFASLFFALLIKIKVFTSAKHPQRYRPIKHRLNGYIFLSTIK